MNEAIKTAAMALYDAAVAAVPAGSKLVKADVVAAADGKTITVGFRFYNATTQTGTSYDTRVVLPE